MQIDCKWNYGRKIEKLAIFITRNLCLEQLPCSVIFIDIGIFIKVLKIFEV